MVSGRSKALPLAEAKRRARRTKLVLTDSDGVLTDNGVYYGENGEAFKRFSIRDGMGVERLRNAGIATGIITGEKSPSVRARAAKLRIELLYLGVKDKAGALEGVLRDAGVTLEQTAFIGDDVNDSAALDAVGRAGLTGAPLDGMPDVMRTVHYRCRVPGGHGAFRDFAEWILNLRGYRGAPSSITIGHKPVGDGHPVYVVAEIGINHNGSLELARRLIDGAADAGADAVKFQKRTPEKCVNADEWHRERDTPWGRMTYIDYRRRIEFGEREYGAIDRHCRERGIQWFASCWDEDSVDFMERFGPPCHKAASASLTDHDLLRKMKATGRPLVVSTGMSTMTEMETAITAIGTDGLLIAHSTSSYPCPPEHVNLRMIATLQARYPLCPIGYSGHESGTAPTVAAVALGATHVERHVTLDRTMWGSDQAASVNLPGLKELVAAIREVERALGDGVKRVYEGELASKKKLRRVNGNGNGNGNGVSPRPLVTALPGGQSAPTTVPG